jgi:hypothetical protein
MAMEVLFHFAAKGCVGGIDDELCFDAPSTINVMEGVAWRTIVHALNILRLIILDATLAPDLHPFIPQVLVALPPSSELMVIGDKNCGSWIQKPTLGYQKFLHDGGVFVIFLVFTLPLPSPSTRRSSLPSSRERSTTIKKSQEERELPRRESSFSDTHLSSHSSSKVPSTISGLSSLCRVGADCEC